MLLGWHDESQARSGAPAACVLLSMSASGPCIRHARPLGCGSWALAAGQRGWCPAVCRVVHRQSAGAAQPQVHSLTPILALQGSAQRLGWNRAVAGRVIARGPRILLPTPCSACAHLLQLFSPEARPRQTARRPRAARHAGCSNQSTPAMPQQQLQRQRACLKGGRLPCQCTH